MKELTLIAYGSGNWNYYTNKKRNRVYYIAKKGSGVNDGLYCSSNKLLSNFWRMRQVKGYRSLIPPSWKIVDYDFFKTWVGINASNC